MTRALDDYEPVSRRLKIPALDFQNHQTFRGIILIVRSGCQSAEAVDEFNLGLTRDGSRE